MAPRPDRPPYEAGVPLDGGGNTSNLAGSPSSFSPTGLEIGLIVGVITVVILSLLWLFVWRSRRIRAAKNAEAAAASTRFDNDATDAQDSSAPAPLPKDDRTSTVDTDEVSSIERPPPSRRRPVVDWNHWVHPTQRNTVEEHEIANRV
ncbi:Uu.00g111030.m01.CDS01 [Anthostomella pinea]|uniref:Uu.00g111030.m01.CDS01 n=1 Tax=Anthostomella pinea TaxID=933095 RepID=A0AAI8VF16_9PEZI|nr:Uu.00g111030.m01.CDS01 [Anthostomella pinea]